MPAPLDIYPDLATYVKELETRFVYGGNFDTAVIPSGETFTEIFSGLIWPYPEDGESFTDIMCTCASAEVAIQVFKDTFERYIGGKTSGTVYWRVYPDLKTNIVTYIELQTQKVSGRPPFQVRDAAQYHVYARVLIQ